MKKLAFLFTLLFVFSIICFQNVCAQVIQMDTTENYFSTYLETADDTVQKETLTLVPNVGAVKVDWEFDWGTIAALNVETDSYRPKITRLDVKRSSGLIAKFAVEGHPDGRFTVSLRDAGAAQGNAAAGRQKNRRVEMTIEFE